MSDREIIVIADDYVDREFGTGALKITPAHDPNDYVIGKRFVRVFCILIRIFLLLIVENSILLFLSAVMWSLRYMLITYTFIIKYYHILLL